MDEADREHALLLNAIKKRDRQAALNRLDEHFLNVKKNISLIIRRESE
jgi:DNA-binding GntR family transcriptional regulator